MLCPYCSERDANSRDEVFTNFLGGRAWILACRDCNSTFGHTIEAAALGDLKNMMFLLRRSGMQPSKPMVWKGIGLGANGETYDIDQDLNAIPCKPVIERDATGRITRAVGSLLHVEQIKESLEREGRAARIVACEPITIIPEVIGKPFPMGDDIKRLCIKMSIAAATKMNISGMLGSRARQYLLDGVIGDLCPVRIAFDQYPDLDKQRPLAGHLVYVRGSSTEQRIYSVVQLFSAIQFYCELSHEHHGPDFAIVATHNPVSHEERFDSISPVECPLPERWVGGTPAERVSQRLDRLRLELVALYGDNATTAFWATGR